MVVDRETETPLEAASIYEIHLTHKYDSHGTRHKQLFHLAYLYSWAKEVGVELDRQFLLGEGLTQPQIRSFAAWLRNRWIQDNGVLPYKKRKTFNTVLSMCSVISRWFISQFASPNSRTQHERTIEVQILTDAQKQMWKDAKVRVRQESVAPDLTEEEIATIENYLRPENRSSSVGMAIATRDYLIWRIAIEFGMRVGEILAMRVEDCPTRNKPYFSVVRIEERGPDYFDPRTDAPRPKTLSRDLGYQLSNTVFPKLVSNYVSEHRYIKVEHKGRTIKRFLLPHKFLIIAKNGNPLSRKMADKIAQHIKQETGVNFHWHMARHAFFNRAYSAVADIKNPTEKDARLADLVVWGGWEDPDSLGIYSRKARRERARTPLQLWQQGGTEWKSLN